ncbi:hypothetical protein M153_672000103 [Pseudoloma neurophilia]|uniref:Uncharacterized protein n=1 Tax=Pseudoloma neurophilia TaxID=146866 RepID=A0A0R0LWW3_9MICR|nr:hypothetical protein M153_672000103 [Pseudoloma neurophilia]
MPIVLLLDVLGYIFFLPNLDSSIYTITSSPPIISKLLKEIFLHSFLFFLKNQLNFDIYSSFVLRVLLEAYIQKNPLIRKMNKSKFFLKIYPKLYFCTNLL